MIGIFLFTLLLLSSSGLANGDIASEAYGKITDGLIGIRKQFPIIQPKIYALLDQVAKLYKIAKTSSTECRELKKKLSDGQHETRSQLASVKKSFDQEKTDLLKQCNEQQQRLLALEKQRDHVMASSSIKNELSPAEEINKA